MKKIILILAVLLAVTCSVSAQKLSKEEKKAQKEAEAAETAALMQKMFSEHCFKFVPEFYSLGNGERINIEGYEELAIRPDSFYCKMSGIDNISVNRYEVVKETTEKSGFTLSVKVEANGAIMTFNFVVNSKTGMGALRVKSNKESDLNYNGSYKSF